MTGPVEPDHVYVMMATRFKVAHRYRQLSVVSATRRLWASISDVDGLTGYSVRAEWWWGRLSTLTAWRDQASLDDFVRAESHAALVAKTRRWMRASIFVSWKIPAAELPPRRDEAARRLDAGPEPDPA